MAGGVDEDSITPGQPDDRSGDAAVPAEKTIMTDPTPKSRRTARTQRTAKSPTKTPTKRKAPTKKATVSQADIDKLEARLKRADTATRKSVSSLETVVAALEASLKTSGDSQTRALTRHVNDLTRRLEQQTEEMRDAVRSELKAAVSNGSIEGLDMAIDQASARLGDAEIVHSNAIAKVNRHLADMARAVDMRIKREGRDRRSELDAVATRLAGALKGAMTDMDRRVSDVERDSAEAFDRVGETIEKIHSRLEQRRQSSTEGMTDKLNELALKTQAEFKTYQAEIDTRFQEAEARYLAVGTGAAERVIERVGKDIDHRLTGLERRLKDVEQRSDTSTSAAVPQAFPPLPDPSVETAETQSSPNPIQTLKDRIGSFRDTSESAAPAATGFPAPTHSPAPARGNPYATALKPADSFETATPPVDFNAPPAPVLPFRAAPQVDINTDIPAPAPMPPFQMPSSLPPLPVADEFLPAPLPDAVFSNPAYAEGHALPDTTDSSPAAIRVAGDAKPKRRLPAISLPGRPVRIALLATGVAIVALMAGRMILGGGGPVESDPVAGGSSSVVQANIEPTSTNPSGTTSPFFTPPAGAETGPNAPIGEYAENRPVEIDPASLSTLDAAVAAGNPIAQFQMGLARLDAGETDAGASLIRQAASANQPAALYRLAKLYEAGEGVPRDDVMARQLIERAARGGNRIAMHDLALYYTEGRGGVALDMATAKSWFEQAARRGVVDSQFNLAVLSENTEIGLEPDPEAALFWYSIAAQQGDQFAVSRRDTLRAATPADRLSEIDARIEAFAPRPIEEEANGIFNNVPWMQSASVSGPEMVREAQTLLSSLGYEVGTPDGMMGSRTRTAITEFQRANSLPETGDVDPALLDRLSQAARS